jgi:hypothetical protein
MNVSVEFFFPAAVPPKDRTTCTSLGRRPSVQQNLSGHCLEEENLLPLEELKSDPSVAGSQFALPTELFRLQLWRNAEPIINHDYSSISKKFCFSYILFNIIKS